MSVSDQTYLARTLTDRRRDAVQMNLAWSQLKGLGNEIDTYVLRWISERAIIADVRKEASKMLVSIQVAVAAA